MNRWVGIVSQCETPPPTPVHRIALAIDAARNRTSYQLSAYPEVPSVTGREPRAGPGGGGGQKLAG
ncbi:hypothetical protein GCM10017589_54740 [Streptomyces poonensis]|nr:hypothetical protein GCM10017589_54740 [Streptomyces poonensis]